jgi:hemoglobin
MAHRASGGSKSNVKNICATGFAACKLTRIMVLTGRYAELCDHKTESGALPHFGCFISGPLMNQPTDILSLGDIKLLVNEFYCRIRSHEVLGPIFDARIDDRWPQHLEKMYTFWQTVLLDEHTYFGSPFPPHANLPVDESHFNMWMGVFTQTVDDLFQGQKADEAKWRSAKMAQMFSIKIEHLRNNPRTSILA